MTPPEYIVSESNREMQNAFAYDMNEDLIRMNELNSTGSCLARQLLSPSVQQICSLGNTFIHFSQLLQHQLKRDVPRKQTFL